MTLPLPSLSLAVTDFTREALDQLRQTDNFQWATVFLLSLAMYVYANEVERRNWSAILAGLALWGMDWINEVANALVLHFTDRAPSGPRPATRASRSSSASTSRSRSCS